MDAVPPAPNPHRVRAAINDPISGAKAHQAIPEASADDANSMIGLRPKVLDNGANIGIQAVEEIRNAVDSQDAEFDVWKSDVMTGWLDAIRVASKLAICIDQRKV